jgi:hypothetical protein
MRMFLSGRHLKLLAFKCFKDQTKIKIIFISRLSRQKRQFYQAYSPGAVQTRMDCSLPTRGCAIVDFDNETTETRMEKLDIPTTRAEFFVPEPDQTERQFFQFFQKPTDANNFNSAQVKPAQAAPVQTAPVPAAPVQIAPVSAAPIHAAPVQEAPIHAAPVPTNTEPGSAARYFSSYYAANPYQYQPYQQNPFYFYQPYTFNYWPYTPQPGWGWERKKRSMQ